MAQDGGQAVAFGPFRLDPAARRLTRDGVALAPGGRAFAVLAALAAAGGETLSKDALLAAAWPGLVVEENNLQVQISALRKLLGEGWIVTVAGRGYRLGMAAAVPPAPAVEAYPLPDRPSIAVLPFANLSGDPGQEFFSDGVAEEILTELSRDRRLFLIGRASSFTFRGGAVDLREVGRALGVRYVVDGSVRRAGARLRIAARLNEAATGATLWSERYDLEMEDIFAIQDAIAQAVTQAVGLAVAEAEQQRARRKPPADLTAWEACQRGLWHLLRLTQADTHLAIGHFRRSTEIDPTFAGAWIGWSQALFALYGAFGEGDIVAGAGEVSVLARRAVACDASDPEAHLSKATAHLTVGEWEDARISVREAERLAPGSPSVERVLGLIEIFSGRREAGRALLDDAMRRDPLNPMNRNSRANYSWSLFQDGKYQDVLAFAHRAISVAPEGELWAYRHIAATLAALGRIDEARAALRKAIDANPKALARYANERLPWQRPEDTRRMQDALRKAGWDGQSGIRPVAEG